MDKDLSPRIGVFFLLVGCILFFLFIGSILGKDTNIIFLVFGGAAITLGFLLRREATPAETARFSAIRKARQRSRQRREEKQSKKEKKHE